MMNTEPPNSEYVCVSKKEWGRLKTIHLEEENKLLDRVHAFEEILGVYTDFPYIDKS